MERVICDCDLEGRARIFLMARRQGVQYRVLGLAAGLSPERVREIVNRRLDRVAADWRHERRADERERREDHDD